MRRGKHVVVIGGGDTASDCVGTSFRQGALSVTQLDIRPRPPEREDKLTVWPYWPTKMRTSSSQAEGAEREFQAATLRIEGKKGRVTGVKCARVDEKRQPIPGSEFILRADLVFLAIGFAGSGEIRACWMRPQSISTGAATCWRTTAITARRARRSSSPATCGAASRWSSGPSAKAARRRTPSTHS